MKKRSRKDLRFFHVISWATLLEEANLSTEAQQINQVRAFDVVHWTAPKYLFWTEERLFYLWHVGQSPADLY